VSRPRILTIDIETRPAQVYVWDIFRPFIGVDQIIDPGGVMCFAAKWHGQKKPIFFSDWDDGHDVMVKAAFEFFNEADVVVTYNGDDFDIRHLNTEFALAGKGEYEEFKSVDLYKIVKRRERHLSHKMLYIARRKNLGAQKLDAGGFQTWVDLSSPDEKVRKRAQRAMRRYNIGDIFTTEEMFDDQRSHIKLPHIALYSEELDGGLTCPEGHSDFEKRGFRRTNTRRYQRYQCRDCGRFFSDTRSSGSVGTA
jgi:DNA polymerase elongation subunit (family B)